jgi:hypothetical protein
MTMNESKDDQGEDRFEEHLRGFRPAAPRALAIPPRRAPWRALAIAAGILIVVGASLVAHHRSHFDTEADVASVVNSTVQPTVTPPVTIGRLNAALRNNDEALNRLLDDASPGILPHGQHGTVLYELGKE